MLIMVRLQELNNQESRNLKQMTDIKQQIIILKSH